MNFALNESYYVKVDPDQISFILHLWNNSYIRRRVYPPARF